MKHAVGGFLVCTAIAAAFIFTAAFLAGCGEKDAADEDDEDAAKEEVASEKKKLRTVFNENARRSRATMECQSLYTAIVAYEGEYSCWPANIGSSDALVSGDDYIGMCKILTGDNSAKKVFYEAGGYDEKTGILDPWDRPYQVVLDGNYDNIISENSIPAVKAVNKVAGRSGQNLRKKAAVYSFGVYEDDKIANDITKLAEEKKLVTSW